MGGEIYPFGQSRLRLLDIILAYLKLRNYRIDTEISQKRVFSILMELIIKNPWNSILHQ